jgi:hypothetical protein
VGISGAQFFRRTVPIFFGRSLGTSSRDPQFVRQRFDFRVSEGMDALTDGGRLRALVSFMGMLERLPRMLVPCEMFLLSILFGGAVRVRRLIVQFGRPLVIFVVRSVVIAC